MGNFFAPTFQLRLKFILEKSQKSFQDFRNRAIPDIIATSLAIIRYNFAKETQSHTDMKHFSFVKKTVSIHLKHGFSSEGLGLPFFRIFLFIFWHEDKRGF